MATYGARVVLKGGYTVEISAPHQEWLDKFVPLFAAAPDLLAALRDWIRMEDEGPSRSGVSPLALYNRARAAIARAEKGG